jgi:hypothetical protein
VKLIVANSRTEEMVGDLSKLSEKARKGGAWGAQRMLWFAADGDVIILPWLPPEAYLNYVTGLTRTDPRSLALVVPPPGELGEQLLTPDRLTEPEFRSELRQTLRDRTVDKVISCFDDYAVVSLVEAIGLADALPGHAFSSQGGVALVNSKAVFRAVATGTGIAVPPGVVTSQRQQAADTIKGILATGYPVMIKQEFAGGGFGNTILAPGSGVTAAGATDVTVLAQPCDVDTYVADTWDWMTGYRDHRVVIERFFTGCTTVYAEFELTDFATELSGTGQILMEPVAAGEIVPPPTLTSDQRVELEKEAARICETFRGLGYRGRLSADAIVTPEGDILFTETNGRVTGSTHLHTVIRGRMLADDGAGRTLLERDSWAVPSYEAAVETLRSTGLGFDPARGSGVVITANYVPVTGAVMYCVVASDIDAARALETRLHALEVRPT